MRFGDLRQRHFRVGGSSLGRPSLSTYVTHTWGPPAFIETRARSDLAAPTQLPGRPHELISLVEGLSQL